MKKFCAEKTQGQLRAMLKSQRGASENSQVALAHKT